MVLGNGLFLSSSESPSSWGSRHAPGGLPSPLPAVHLGPLGPPCCMCSLGDGLRPLPSQPHWPRCGSVSTALTWLTCGLNSSAWRRCRVFLFRLVVWVILCCLLGRMLLPMLVTAAFQPGIYCNFFSRVTASYLCAVCPTLGISPGICWWLSCYQGSASQLTFLSQSGWGTPEPLWRGPWQIPEGSPRIQGTSRPCTPG